MPRHATPEMLDKLAEGVAAGATWKDAAIAAGWKPASNTYYRLRNDPEFQRRIERCRRRREWGGVGDLGDMVGSLLKTAQAQGDTAEKNLSRLCLVSAAQLFVKMTESSLEADTTRHHPSTIKHQPGTTKHQPGTTKHQPSTIEHHPSTTGHQADPVRSEAEELRHALDEWAETVGVK